MRHSKNIIFLVFFIIAFISVWVNIIFVESENTVSTDVIESLDGIYLYEKDLEKEKYEGLIKIINSNNVSVLKKMIEQKFKQVTQFYSFCAFLKNNQKYAVDNLGIVMDRKKTKIIVNGESMQSYLGYAILLLFKEKPSWLVNDFSQEFLDECGNYFMKAYKSEIFSEYPVYHKTLSELIFRDFPVLSEQIINQVVDFADLNDLTAEQVSEIYKFIDYIPSDKLDSFILILLDSNKTEYIKKVIEKINSSSSEKIAEKIESIIYGLQTEELVNGILDKYCLIKQNNSIPFVKKVMKTYPTKKSIIINCLNNIRDYGDISEYSFVESYIGNQYSPEVNIAAINTLIEIAYKQRSEDVINLMTYVIRNSNSYIPPKRAIEFHIENNISKNRGLILLRLRQRESLEMEKTAVRYIEHFNINSADDFLRLLINSRYDEIVKEAERLLNK